MKKEYKLIIFDLDGTLADTSRGILDSHKHTLVAMGKEEPTDKELDGIIGGPLLKTYINRFGFNEEDANTAINIYRKFYATNGVLGVELYDNMAEVLKQLNAKGYKCAVATLKAENLAYVVLANLGIKDEFLIIHGVDSKDTLTKSDLINMCINESGVSKSEAILVGDSYHDMNGAKEVGIDFLAVTYGFGLKKQEEISDPYIVNIVDKPNDLLHIF